jgi:hypothetical protein
MIADVITQIPWYCDDKDCPHKWHLGTFWTNDDEEDIKDGCPYTYDSFSDGDHEPEESMPSWEEENQAWIEYAEWVVENAEDPLGQYMVKRTIRSKRYYEVEYKPTVAGAMAVRFRRGHRGKWEPIDNVPKDIKMFFLIEKRNRVPYCDEYKSFNDFIVYLTGAENAENTRRTKKGVIVGGTVEDDQQRKESAYKRDLLRAARRDVRDRKKRISESMECTKPPLDDEESSAYFDRYIAGDR